jgi:hypothetical protein
VFSLGEVLGLIGRLAFRTFDDSWQMQVVVNVVGLGSMIALGAVLERTRKRPALPAAPLGVPADGIPRAT